MKTTKEMIEVMEHYENGGEIEYCSYDNATSDWKDVKYGPTWCWSVFDYRIKENKKTITMEKWLMIRGDEYYICNTNKVDNYALSTPVKLLDTYEIEI